jgi:nucleotide-binding universal stress UspA family protein
MKILLAVSQSEASKAAVKFLMRQMAFPGTEVRLLHVLDPYPERLAKRMGSSDRPDFTSARRMQLELAGNLLRQATKELNSAGFVVTSSTREGDVPTLIIDEARASHADLIVVGWKERKGIRSFFSSNISEDVSRYAPCSVVIVRIAPWATETPCSCPDQSAGASNAA